MPHDRAPAAPRAALACLLLAITSCSSSNATDVPGSLLVTSVVIGGAPDPLVVHQRALLALSGRAADGTIVPLRGAVTWRTADAGVASISGSGVITAHRRGSVTIGASWGELRTELTLRVTGRLEIIPSYAPRGCGYCGTRQIPATTTAARPLQVGDTLDLSAMYVDVDGLPLGGATSVTWTSSHPSAVSVSPSGRVIPLLPNSLVQVRASTEDGFDTQDVRVWDVAAGTAQLRLGHAVAGLGALTFVHNKGEPVTLEFGEFVDLPISAGLFYVDVEGVPPGAAWFSRPLGFEAISRDGDDVEIYVVGGVCCGVDTARVGLVGGWDDRPRLPVPQDSARIRLIQGWTSAGVVYVLPRGAAVSGLPTLCYFDPGDIWGYRSLAADEIDFVLQTKYSRSVASTRIEVDLEAGRSATYVLTQGPGQAPGIVGFKDP